MNVKSLNWKRNNYYDISDVRGVQRGGPQNRKMIAYQWKKNKLHKKYIFIFSESMFVKVCSHGAAAAVIFCVFHCVATESVHSVWLRQWYSSAMLMQNTLPLLQPHKIGLEPIYLPHLCLNHCHCCTVWMTPLVIMESNCNSKKNRSRYRTVWTDLQAVILTVNFIFPSIEHF